MPFSNGSPLRTPGGGIDVKLLQDPKAPWKFGNFIDESSLDDFPGNKKFPDKNAFHNAYTNLASQLLMDSPWFDTVVYMDTQPSNEGTRMVKSRVGCYDISYGLSVTTALREQDDAELSYNALFGTYLKDSGEAPLILERLRKAAKEFGEGHEESVWRDHMSTILTDVVAHQQITLPEGSDTIGNALFACLSERATNEGKTCESILGSMHAQNLAYSRTIADDDAIQKSLFGVLGKVVEGLRKVVEDLNAKTTELACMIPRGSEGDDDDDYEQTKAEIEQRLEQTKATHAVLLKTGALAFWMFRCHKLAGDNAIDVYEEYEEWSHMPLLCLIRNVRFDVPALQMDDREEKGEFDAVLVSITFKDEEIQPPKIVTIFEVKGAAPELPIAFKQRSRFVGLYRRVLTEKASIHFETSSTSTFVIGRLESLSKASADSLLEGNALAGTAGTAVTRPGVTDAIVPRWAFVSFVTVSETSDDGGLEEIFTPSTRLLAIGETIEGMLKGAASCLISTNKGLFNKKAQKLLEDFWPKHFRECKKDEQFVSPHDILSNLVIRQICPTTLFVLLPDVVEDEEDD